VVCVNWGQAGRLLPVGRRPAAQRS
jgi:hypothetical protein